MLMQICEITETWKKEANASVVVRTDQISSANERSSVIVEPGNDRLTEVRSKSIPIMATVNNQDKMQNFFTHSNENP